MIPIPLDYIVECTMFIIGLTLGYLFANLERNKQDNKSIEREDIPHDSPIIQRQTPREQKPGGIFAEDIPSGPVERPDVKMIKEWEKSDQQRGSEEAMSNIFANDPELVKTKSLISKFRESTGMK